MILAEKILQLRKKNGWSQEEFGEKLDVSRQAVSKWEGAQSVPDLNKILLMSKLFGVSTDYLLKDEMEEIEYMEGGSDAEPDSLRHITIEEANSFLQVKEQTAKRIAFGAFLCVISPILLLILGAGSETGAVPLTENAAGGMGMVIMLLLVALAVALFISSGMKTSKYEYMEKESFLLDYGVEGMVRERQDQYAKTYALCNIIGTCLCILAIIPMFICLCFTEDDFIIVLTLGILLFVVAIAVVFFIIAGVRHESTQKILQEGDYTKTRKASSSFRTAVSTAYWLSATALYLGISFFNDSWDRSWIVWAIAAVLYPVLMIICRELKKKS